MELKLISQPSGKTATLGTLVRVDAGRLTDNLSPICRTLEDVVREPAEYYGGDDRAAWVAIWKKLGETAIPSGRYRVEVTYSPKFKRWLPVLHDVPGFTGIRIHAGNTSADTDGCILVGKVMAPMTDQDEEIGYSRAALDGDVIPLLGECYLRGEEVWITIVRI